MTHFLLVGAWVSHPTTFLTRFSLWREVRSKMLSHNESDAGHHPAQMRTFGLPFLAALSTGHCALENLVVSPISPLKTSSPTRSGMTRRHVDTLKSEGLLLRYVKSSDRHGHVVRGLKARGRLLGLKPGWRLRRRLSTLDEFRQPWI